MNSMQVIGAPQYSGCVTLATVLVSSSTSATALPYKVQALDLKATVDCFVIVDMITRIVTSTNGMFIGAGERVRVLAPNGDVSPIVSAIRATADGNLYITPFM